jgi:pimeloyl-ACP methyl ester carboxylesterase
MEKSVIINGITINYLIAGEGEAIVLIHGHPFDHTMWQPQIDAFSGRYQVIVPDLRGYGKSGLPEGGVSRFEDYSTDILQLLDILRVDNFHVAGLSMGGQLAMEVYRQAPSRVKSLILADTFATLDTPEAKKARNDGADRMLREGMGGYANESIHKMIKAEHVSTMPGVAAHVMRMMTTTNPKGAAMAMRARSERIDYLNEVLPQIKVPVLIVVGRQDEFTPVAKAEEMHAAIRGSKLVVIEDAGHMPNLEHPEAFNKIMLDFLEVDG